MARVSIVGIVVGGIADVGLSIFLSLPLSIYAVMVAAASHTPKQQVPQTATAFMHRPSILISAMVIGFACSMFGGYLSAFIARRDEILNGGFAAFLCVGLGIWSIATHLSSDPLWMQILLLIASPIVSCAGGYLRLKQKRPNILTVELQLFDSPRMSSFPFLIPSLRAAI